MPLGNLDRKITIQYYPQTRGSTWGEVLKVWTTYATCWGQKIEATGKEELDTDQVVSKQMIQWRIRYDSGVNERMRIYYDGDYYNIESIQEEKRRRYLVLNTLKTDGE